MALVAISALPSSAVIASSDILPTVVSGTTKKITAGVLRTQLFAFAAADPLNIGPLTAVGNSTVTGTLSGITTLTAAVVHATTPSVFDDTLKANTLILGASGGGIEEWFTNGAATILVNFNGYAGGTTQFRSFIVYDGKNTNLFSIVGATGTVTISTGNLTFGAANSRIVPGATSFAIRNTTNAANNFVIDNSGNVIILGTLASAAITAPSLVISTGGISLNGTSAGIRPGPTSFIIRNNADSTTNFTFSDAGVLTSQGSVGIVVGSFNAAAGTTANASLNIPHGVAPTSPNNGDMWTTTAGAFIRINGVTKTFTLT